MEILFSLNGVVRKKAESNFTSIRQLIAHVLPHLIKVSLPLLPNIDAKLGGHDRPSQHKLYQKKLHTLKRSCL